MTVVNPANTASEIAARKEIIEAIKKSQDLEQLKETAIEYLLDCNKYRTLYFEKCTEIQKSESEMDSLNEKILALKKANCSC